MGKEYEAKFLDIDVSSMRDKLKAIGEWREQNSFDSIVNIINGGKHGVTDDLKIQEFMIFPNEKYSISKKIQVICEVYQTLQKILVEKYGKNAKSIGD